MRDRVSRVRGKLPEEIDEPIIAKQDADAKPGHLDRAVQRPLLHAGTDHASPKTSMKDRLQTVQGREFHIHRRQQTLRHSPLAGRGKNGRAPSHRPDVEQALRKQNVELPSGRVENLDREMTIQTLGEMKTAEEFNRLVVRSRTATRSFGCRTSATRASAWRTSAASRVSIPNPPCGLGIVKQSKANTIEVAHGIKAELERLIPLLPEGMETDLPYDESIYVEQSIHEVWLTLGIAFGLVVITIFVFLRNVRSTLIPCLTIPVAIVGTFSSWP